MVNKIDLIDDLFSEGKDFSDLDQKKQAIETNRKQVQDQIIAGLELEGLHASVLTGVKENEGHDDESQIGVAPSDKNREIRVQACSAKTQEGIWEGLKQMADIFDK